LPPNWIVGFSLPLRSRTVARIDPVDPKVVFVHLPDHLPVSDLGLKPADELPSGVASTWTVTAPAATAQAATAMKLGPRRMG
jgi:hypothetical protein